MKVGISSAGENLEAEVDPRFGRCKYFVIVDTETMNFESIANESFTASGGAGIQAAQTVAQKGVNAVITGNVGPNAFQTLSAAGIKIFIGASGSIKKVVEQFKKGEIQEADSPSVNSHFCTGAVRGHGRGGNL